MYAKIRQERNGFQPRAVTVAADDGTLIGDEGEIMERWAQYFEDLLNVNGGEQEEEPSWIPDPIGMSPVEEPTILEVKKALKHMRNYKAAGDDGIAVELLKKAGDEYLERLWNLILSIWRDEEMPNDWKMALICPVHKKGNKALCKNYRGIALLNVAYKIFSRILAERLQAIAENCVGDYQCGFRRGRSTIDQIFIVRMILEKCYEFNVDVHQLFVDFKQAYDSVKRKNLCEILQRLGVPLKLAKLVWVTLTGSTNKIKIQNATSKAFNVTRGLRQGDPASSVLFNFVLENIMRVITTNPGGTLFNRSVFWTAYADDVDIIARTTSSLIEAFAEMETASREVGLEINGDKTKYMPMLRRRGNVPQTAIICGAYNFEKVDKFKYLGAMLTENNDRSLEIKLRIQAGNRSYYGLQRVFRSKSVSRKLKKLLYRTIIRPAVMYAAETWVMTRKDESTLNIWERRILRKIYGPIYENNQWRVRTNNEIYALYDEPTIVAEIKRSRLRWVGHVERMSNTRAAKKVWQQKPEGRRNLGRPRLRWEDDIQNDIQQLGIRGWRRLAQDRTAWRRVVEQARTLHGL